MRKTIKTSKRVVVGLIVLLVALTGCKKEEKASEYLTFTHTKTMPDDTFASEVYQYFMGKEEKPQLIAEVPYTSQYPLTVYDSNQNRVYFTSRIPKTKIDQIFEYNPSTKEQVQITETLGAINYLVPFEKGLFIGALPLEVEDLFVRPFFYEYDTKKLIELPFDKELSINLIAYDQNRKTIFMSVHNQLMDREALINQDKEEYVPPVNVLMSIDSELSIKELVSTPKLTIADLSVIDDTLFVRGFKSYSDDFEMYKVNLNSDVYELIATTDEDNELLDKIGNFLGVEKSGKLIYFIDGLGGVTEYDKDKKTVRTVFEATPNRSTVNNGLIVTIQE